MHPPTQPVHMLRKTRFLPFLCVGMLLVGAWASAEEHPPLVRLNRLVDSAYLPKATADHYRTPDHDDLRAWELLFSDLLALAPIPDARIFSEHQTRAEDLGYTLRALTLDDTVCWVLQEREIGGGGLFLIRIGAAAPLFIQAPHMRNDKHSERCATRCFWTSEARLAAFSTMSRFTVDPAPGRRYGPADMSHQEQSFLTGATRAAATTMPNLVVVQFHGYSHATRNLPPRTLILSNGSRQPDATVTAVASHLRRRWAPLELLIYPDDITVLGGLLNAQGNALRRFPQHGFLHLEMSLSLRNSLLDGPPEAFDLRGALSGIMERAR